MSAYASPSLTYTITGINGPALDNAKKRLLVSQKAIEKSLTPSDINSFYREGAGQIIKAIEPYGYFKAKVSSRLTRQGTRWIAHYSVNPGSQIIISEVQLKISDPGKRNEKIKKFQAHFPIKQGDIFNSINYEKAKNKLLDVAQTQGYIRAKFIKSRASIYLSRYACIVTLELDTGPQFYYGNILFSKTPLAEKFLQRYVTFKRGQPLSFNKLLTLQQTLNGTGYFESASVVALEKKEKMHHVPININLKMRKKREYRFGLGYGTNSGPRGTVGYSMNWVNQYGHKFTALLKVSNISTSLSSQYLIPGKNPAQEHYAINASIYRFEPTRGNSLVKSIGFARIKNFFNWQQTIALTAEHERYQLNQSAPTRSSFLVYPSITFSRSNKNEMIQTRNGYNLSINMLGSYDEALSTASLFQTHIEYAQIFTLLNNNRFVLHGEYGYDLVHDINRRLPLSKYFYTGGIDSVRGYRYEGLGPGRFLLIGSAEYQRRIYGHWYAAAFYDIGNAVMHINDKLMRGVGGGVVWQTRIGALRVYIARALDRKGNPLSFMFSFGPDI